MIEIFLNLIESKFGRRSERLFTFTGNRPFEARKQNQLPIDALGSLQRIKVVIDAIPRLFPFGRRPDSNAKERYIFRRYCHFSEQKVSRRNITQLISIGCEEFGSKMVKLTNQPLSVGVN